jgi:hypothetical protein
MVRTASGGGYAKFGWLPIGPVWRSDVETAVLTEDCLGRSGASYCRLRMVAVTAFELLRQSLQARRSLEG